MAELDKIIKQLEVLIEDTKYSDIVDLTPDDAKTILELLKEKEAVAPIRDDRIWLCGNCREFVGFEDHDEDDPNEFDNYCRNCGRKVKWD